MIPLITWLVYLFFGVCLFVYSSHLRPFDEERLIYDLIWLDAWSLSFLTAVVLLWWARISGSLRTFYLLTTLGAYGVVFIAIVFDGTVFGFNAYWGDQQFRIAQILHFAAFGWDTDFFYKNLPPFYPPLYYFVLAMYAKIFSVEAYKMMKTGMMLLSVIGPVGVYFLWKKLVSPFQALVIAFVAVLFSSTSIPFIFWGAHEYVGDMIFFPWWLCFIERVKHPSETVWFYVVGGLIGAVIFATYFHAFFIVAFLIVLRVTIFRSWSFLTSTPFRLRSALGVLSLAAVFSSPYWLPLFISIARFGMDRSRGGWHHIGSPGLGFEYTSFTWMGLLFLAALAYAAKRFRTPLYRGLLILVGTVTLFFLFGSITGAMDMSLNLVKARDFVTLAAIPIVGLFLAAILRWSAPVRKRRYAVAVVVIALMTFILNGMNSTAKDRMVRVARKSTVPTWGIDAREMTEDRGAVFLTSIQQVCSFYPVYSFIVNNEHYSHPASRFKQRFDLLYQLQSVGDPYLFHLVLRTNIFDPVDYFMPDEKDGRYQFPVSLSNYPSKWTTKYLSYAKSVVSDTTLFTKKSGRHQFRLLQAPPTVRTWVPDPPFASPVDSVVYLDRLRRMSSYLTFDGQNVLKNYLGTDFSAFRSLPMPHGEYLFGDSIALLNIDAVPGGDSTLMIFVFEARETLAGNYRVFLHLFDGDRPKLNLDFSPQISTNKWEKWDIIFCYRMIPTPSSTAAFDLGFFIKDSRLGRTFQGRMAGQT